LSTAGHQAAGIHPRVNIESAGWVNIGSARTAKGFRFVTVGSDARLLAAGSQQIMRAMRAPQA